MTRIDLNQKTSLGLIIYDSEVQEKYNKALETVILNAYVRIEEEAREDVKRAIDRLKVNMGIINMMSTPKIELIKMIFKDIVEERINDFLASNNATTFCKSTNEEECCLPDVAEIMAKEYAEGKAVYEGYLTDDDVETMLEHHNLSVIYNDDVDEEEHDDTDDTEGESHDTYHYRVSMNIGYHKDYNCQKLANRIAARLRYKWPLNYLFVEVERTKNGFKAFATIFTAEGDLQSVFDKVHFRLGEKSGKPWKRCKITSVSFYNTEEEG